MTARSQFWQTALEATAVSLFVLTLVLVAIQQYAVVWDEGLVFARQDALTPWLNKLVSANADERGRLMQQDVIDRHWQFSKEEPDGHGPFYCLLSLGGRWLTQSFLPPPASYRFGSGALFAIAIGCVYATLRPRWGRWTAIAATALLASIPRAVPEACFALVDGPLFSLALLMWCGFVHGMEGSWLGRVGFGTAMGLAMATKLPGWFFFAPYLGWTLLYSLETFLLRSPRSRNLDVPANPFVGDARFPIRAAWLTLIVGGMVALAVVLIVNVGWWPDPIAGVTRFFRSNLTRKATTHIPILFLGQRYDFALPWYNTIVWTVAAMPAGTFLLGLLSIGRGIGRWRSDRFATLLILNWALLMVVRATPQAPGHDGTRQLNISFAFLSLLAGSAIYWLATCRNWRQWLAVPVVALAVGESVGSTILYHPLQLSYYSPLVGGLPGAERLGFEPTYYWDALTPEVLAWIDDSTPPDECVFFDKNPVSFDYLQQWGRMRTARLGIENFGNVLPRWFIMQHRPGLYEPPTALLALRGTPVYQKKLFGVPLISIYPFRQYQEAMRDVRQIRRDSQ